MQVLIAPNENFIFGEKTLFSADEAAGQTALSCENPQGFAAGDFVVLGRSGSETAEIRKIASTSTNSISVTVATSFAHYTDDPIVYIRYDQRKFYRSTTKGGSYSHLSGEGSPVNIEVDRPEGTSFEDSTGSSTSWYKATYYNSATAAETSVDDALAAEAGDAEAYTTIFKIRQEAGFEENDYISSELINRYREEAQMQIDGTLAIRYTVPFSSVPKLITHITTLLAAGLLLAKEYGVEADTEVAKTGERKIQRAETLLQKIVDGNILLITPAGSTVSTLTSARVSGSNAYDSTIEDKGEMFNLRDENFQMTDPSDPTSSSDRLSQDSRKTGTQWSSQK